MIAHEKDFLPWKVSNHLRCYIWKTKSKVTQNIDSVIIGNFAFPVADNDLIHLSHRGELSTCVWTKVFFYYVLMVEV